MLPWAQARINQIGLLPEPRALLLRRWPSEVPTLRQGGLTPLQLASRARSARQDRKRFQSSRIPEGDPRIAWNEGRRKADNIRGTSATRSGHTSSETRNQGSQGIMSNPTDTLLFAEGSGPFSSTNWGRWPAALLWRPSHGSSPIWRPVNC